MANNFQACPLCNARIEFSAHYPHYVCNSCIREAVDKQGEHVIFFHAHFRGRDLQGYIRRNNGLIPFPGNTCYIRGVKCFARYDSENGIMVQPVSEEFVEEKFSVKKHSLETVNINKG